MNIIEIPFTEILNRKYKKLDGWVVRVTESSVLVLVKSTQQGGDKQ